MYVFNKITVTPQLPERIKDLSKIANNLWWSWNSEFLRLFKQIDIDLWDKIEKKHPVIVSQRLKNQTIDAVNESIDFLTKVIQENQNNLSK